MAFIRKVKTKSGATAVQIIHEHYGRITYIDHIGSAHNQEELAFLIALAKIKLLSSQPSLFQDAAVSSRSEL